MVEQLRYLKYSSYAHSLTRYVTLSIDSPPSLSHSLSLSPLNRNILLDCRSWRCNTMIIITILVYNWPSSSTLLLSLVFINIVSSSLPSRRSYRHVNKIVCSTTINHDVAGSKDNKTLTRLQLSCIIKERIIHDNMSVIILITIKQYSYC